MANKAVGLLTFNFGANMSGFDRALKKAQKNLKKFGRSMERTGQTLTRNITLPIVGFGAAALKFGSDLQETDSKFKQVFSGVREEAEKTAKTFQESFGLSELAAKDMLSGTGSLLVGFGFTEEAALKLSKEVNALAVDVASFSNFAGGSKGASEALTKALLGETESAKSLDIVIKQGTKGYKDRTKAIMIEKGVNEMQAKALQNLEIMYQQTEKAQGDYARTSEDFANQMRLVKEQLITLAGDMGERLIPMAQKVIDKIKGLTKWFNGLSDSTKDSIVQWGLIVAAIGPALIIFGRLATGFSALIPVIGGVTKALGILGKAILTNPLGVLVSALALAAGAFITYKTVANNAKTANDEFDKSTETLAEKIKRWDKLIDPDIGKTNIEIGLNKVNREIKELRENLKGDLPEKFVRDLSKFWSKASGGQEAFALKGPMKDLQDLLDLRKKLLEAHKKEKEALTITAVEIGGVTDETIKYKRSLDPLIKSIENFIKISKKMWHEGGLLEGPMTAVEAKYIKLFSMQDAWNDSVSNFGNLFSDSLSTAMTSQENFFESFINNLKKAVAQQIAMLAALEITGFLLGGIFGGALTKGLPVGAGSFLKNLLSPFAEGGIVTGPTAALIGESGPEAVIPLDKLNQYGAGGTQNIVVTGKIVGNDIWLSNQKTQFNRLRTS